MISSTQAAAVPLNKHRRLIEWGRLLAGYSFVQAAAQGLGFLAGITVVRALPKEDYACFMIVNTIGPVMNLLSDTGITNSLSAIGGKFWQDTKGMGQPCQNSDESKKAAGDLRSCCDARAHLDAAAQPCGCFRHRVVGPSDFGRGFSFN